MIMELHRQKIEGLVLLGIQINQYYAVDYFKRFYITRVLAIAILFYKVKFLQFVSMVYEWPKYDDTH